MTKSHKVFFAMILLLVLALVAVSSGLFLADRYLAQQANTISDLRADDELLSVELINSQKLRDDLQKYSYLDEMSDEILPGTKNQSEVILIINEIARKTHVNIETYTFKATEDKPGDKTQTVPLKNAPSILVFPVNVNFRGSYNQIISWLKLAEQNQRKMQVAQIDISPVLDDEGRPRSDLFDVAIIVNAYVEK